MAHAAPAILRRSIPSPDKLKAILFDVDGTLCDSDPLHYLTFRDLLQKIGFQGGVPITREYFNSQISGKHNPDIGRILFPDWDEGRRDQFMEDKEAHFRTGVKQLQPLPGLSKLRKWIEDKNLKRAAVTNAPKANAVAMIKQLGLEDFFQVVIIGSECERAKPYPDPYLKALEHFNISADSAFVFEDSASGIAAGVAAGLPVVGLTTGNPAPALLAAGATFLVKDYEDPAIWSALEPSETMAVAAIPTASL